MRKKIADFLKKNVDKKAVDKKSSILVSNWGRKSMVYKWNFKKWWY